MKDEIKEMLDDLRNKKSYINDETILTFDEAKLLLDYITNLQVENKFAKEYEKKYRIAKSRNEKAIEYTKQFINGKTSRIDEWKNVELVLETIVQLLQGEDNETN